MGRGVRTYSCCQPLAGGRIRSKVIKCAAYGVAIMNGRRGWWFMKLMKLKKKGSKISDVFTSPEKIKILSYIYEVVTWGKK